MQLPRPSSIFRRLLVVAVVGFTLTSLASLAWAAPLDSATRNDPAVFAGTATLTPSRTPTTPPTPMPTATFRANATPAFITQPSMAGDAGSSMGADAPGSGASSNATGQTTSGGTAPVSSSGGACTPLTPGNAFAASGFAAQWQAGEGLTANFWGPAGTPGLMEPYAEAAGGQRTVQYFDKGRMELTPPNTVTNGLLATEMITGQVQVGNGSFQAKAAPAIPIAGDPDNAGPTYAGLGGAGASLLAPTGMATGQAVTARVAADGSVSGGSGGSDAATMLVGYDAATQHNVPQAFAQYREKVSVAAVGLAKSEAFFATVRVGGVAKVVMMQVFERRVLTYTADNDVAFRVEMGNIGQHYYRWRYCS